MKRFKKIKKVLFVLCIVLASLLLNFVGLTNKVYSAEIQKDVYLQNIGDCGSLLEYNGVTVITTFVGYYDENNLCPAYCLNSSLPGVGENGDYTVSTSDLVADIGLWKRVINGYPYKTVSELGCFTKEEAFTATKHAIYCYIQGNNPNSYSAIGEAGERTLNAMWQIINNAENSNETKLLPSINIKCKSDNWKIDTIDSKYLSKTYIAQSNTDFNNYVVSIDKEGDNNLPKGTIITNSKNKEQTSFAKGESFKVLIPIDELKSDGTFILNVKSEMKTKPVLYGKPASSDLQDYAVTTLKYEDGEGSFKDKYEKYKAPEKEKEELKSATEVPQIKKLPVTGM